MSSKDGDDNGTMNQNNNIIIKESNNSLDEIIDNPKSFEDQIKSIRKVENLMSISLLRIMVIKS